MSENMLNMEKQKLSLKLSCKCFGIVFFSIILCHLSGNLLNYSLSYYRNYAIFKLGSEQNWLAWLKQSGSNKEYK